MDSSENRSAVLAAILAGPTTPARLSEDTGLPAETVAAVTGDLLRDGLIIESPAAPSPSSVLDVRDDLGVVCGIDLGATNCRFVLADLRGQLVNTSHELTPASIGPAALADWIASRLRALSVTAAGPLRGAAVGLPGSVTLDGTAVSAAPNLRQIEGEMFARRLTRAIPAPVQLGNDADLAMWGELRFGAGRGLRTAVTFTIGTGLGAGVIVAGELLRGRRGQAGEFGYLPTGPSGETVEDLLSGTGLLRNARALRAPVRDVPDVFGSLAEELLDPVRERFDRALLLILTAATVAYDPEAIILGGGLTPVVAERLHDVRERLAAMVPVAPELRLASLGDLSGALGALAMASQLAYRALGVSERDAASLPPVESFGALSAAGPVIRRASV
jgi:predicted NBD/HSP70 family sugar kinase